MAPVLSANGEKVNCINYKTGISHVNFRMNATTDDVLVAIEILHKDEVFASSIYQQFFLLKENLHSTLTEPWLWEEIVENESNQLLSRISKRHTGTNVLMEKDWPVIISFLKPRIIALDKFWCEYKFIFEMAFYSK